jgi:hypothetical protein
MKKIVLAIVAIAALCGAAQAQRHIEYRWHGVYVVGDASYGFNLNRSVDEFDTIASVLNAFMPGVSAGFQFRKEAGVGVGFNYVADPTKAYTQLPVFVELRSHFLRSQLTPYGVLQVGYCMPMKTSSAPDPISTEIMEGGLYFGLEVGARYAINRSFAVALHAGYRLLQSNSVGRYSQLGVDRQPILATPVNLHVLTIGTSFYLSN